MEYRSKKDIEIFLKRNPELEEYRKMLIEFHKTTNFNLFFSKLRRTYEKNKDKTILNELETAYNLKTICGFHVVFMPEKDFNSNPHKLKQGGYMIFQLPNGVKAKDLAKTKTPDLLVFFRGEPFYTEVKTITSKIINAHKILQRITKSSKQIKNFGQGLIQIFCEKIGGDVKSIFKEIEKETEKHKDIMGVLITYYDLISEEKVSKNHTRQTFRKKTKYINNKNFERKYINKLNVPKK